MYESFFIVFLRWADSDAIFVVYCLYYISGYSLTPFQINYPNLKIKAILLKIVPFEWFCSLYIGQDFYLFNLIGVYKMYQYCSIDIIDLIYSLYIGVNFIILIKDGFYII